MDWRPLVVATSVTALGWALTAIPVMAVLLLIIFMLPLAFFGHGRRARPWQASKRFLRSINNRTCRHYRRRLDFYFPCYALDITQTPILSDTHERGGAQGRSGPVRVSRPGSGRFAKGDDAWRGR